MAKDKIDTLQQMINGSTFDIDSIIDATVNSKAFENLKNISIQKIMEDSKFKNTSQNVLNIIKQTESQQVAIESSRMSKYNDYDDISKSLPFVTAAINIYVDNMTTPDNNYEQFLNISHSFSKNQSSSISYILRNIDQIAKHINIEDITDQIAYDLYKYGDYFIEIEETQSVLTKYKILIDSENEYIPKINNNVTVEHTFKLKMSEPQNVKNSRKKEPIPILECDEVIIESSPTSNNDINDITILTESKDDKPNENESIPLYQISAVVHSPKNVVIIYKGRNILGYLLILPTPGEIPIGEAMGNQILDTIFKNGLNEVKNVVKENPQYATYISALLNSYDSGVSEVKTKYIPKEKMIHRANGNLNFPYGTSRLDAITEYAKYSIIGQRSNMLYRFTRAPSLRVFKVDTGLDTDSAKYIQQVKREISQRKYSLNPKLDIDTLSQTLTQFDDIWVPTRQGQEFFTIDQTVSGDLQSKVEDLRMLDNHIISGLQLPPIYLGLDRGEDSRYTLSQMNANFGKSIYRLNKILSSGIDELIKGIYGIVFDDTPLLNSIVVGLQKPTSLYVERESEIYSNISNIMQTMDSLKIPKSYYMSKLMPWIDKNELEESNLEESVNNIETSKGDNGSDDDDDNGMF